MNIHVDTLDYANDLPKAGIERAHAEAIARLQARPIVDLVEHELVTKDSLCSELAQLEARLETKFRDGIRREATQLQRNMDGLMPQIRALQFGGAIAASALGAVVLLTRFIR